VRSKNSKILTVWRGISKLSAVKIQSGNGGSDSGRQPGVQGEEIQSREKRLNFGGLNQDEVYGPAQKAAEDHSRNQDAGTVSNRSGKPTRQQIFGLGQQVLQGMPERKGLDHILCTRTRGGNS